MRLFPHNPAPKYSGNFHPRNFGLLLICRIVQKHLEPGKCTLDFWCQPRSLHFIYHWSQCGDTKSEQNPVFALIRSALSLGTLRFKTETLSELSPWIFQRRRDGEDAELRANFIRWEFCENLHSTWERDIFNSSLIGLCIILLADIVLGMLDGVFVWRSFPLLELNFFKMLEILVI